MRITRIRPMLAVTALLLLQLAPNNLRPAMAIREHTSMPAIPYYESDSWQNIRTVLDEQIFRDIYTGPGGLSDPGGGLELIRFGPGLHEKLTEPEQVTHLVMWTMLGSAPNSRLIDPNDTVFNGLLNNAELTGISSVPNSKCAGRIAVDGHGGQVWCRLLADGTRAVALVNMSGEPGTVAVRWADLGLKGLQPVHDMLLQRDLAASSESFTADVPSHGCVLLKIGSRRSVKMADLIIPNNVIVPGTVWTDTSGNVIQAHGAGMIKVGDTFYWFGEDKTHGSHFQNMKCYSSKDLVHWKFESDALPQQPSGDMGPNRVGERPKVIFNKATKQYVMYVHCESPNYSDAKVAVAVSPSVTGPYTLLSSFRPLDHQSRDMTLYQDDDNSAYLIHEDRARGVGIAELSPDYTKVDHEVTLIHHGYEAPAVLKRDGLYYLLGSFMSGWNDNDNQYATAQSLAGPWSDWRNVGVAGTKTYHSQTASLLTIRGSRTTSTIYVGDRWKPKNLTDSRYIWLPMRVGNGTMELGPERPWTIDLKTGEIKIVQPWGQQTFH